MLNPLFSIKHMYNLFPMFCDTTQKVRASLVSLLDTGPQDIDLLHWMERIALENIGQGGLGYSFDSLKVEHVSDEYMRALNTCVSSFQKFYVFRPLLPYLNALGPAWLRRCMVAMIPFASIQKFAAELYTLEHEAVKIFKVKRHELHRGDAAALRQMADGKNILSVLMEANMAASEEDRLSEAEVIDQIS